MNNLRSPLRNASITGENILSHSGEFSPKFTDVVIPGRSLNFRFVRTYGSSQSDQIGNLGRGWTFNYARRFERSANGLLYFDGEGRSLEFIKSGSGTYLSPAGLYCELIENKMQLIQNFRYGTNQIFELPEYGGRMLQIIDKNNNSINFVYEPEKITIIDTLKRNIVLSIKNGLINNLEDFTGRNWIFNYDNNQCLIEVKQPGTRDFPDGTSLKYVYDTNNKLSELLNARAKTFLKNYYDEKNGRVIAQEHGNGKYKFEYKEIKSSGGNVVLNTTSTLKNGSILSQLHNEIGNEVSRKLLVSASAFAPDEKVEQKDGFVSIVTFSEYNEHEELVKRVYPRGNGSEWIYNDAAVSPKDQGNLIQLKSFSSEKADKILVTSYEYSKDFQLLVSETNPKGQKDTYNYDTNGNLINKTFATVTVQPIDLATDGTRKTPVSKGLFENYEYNVFGQVVKKTTTDGTLQLNCYYPENDPLGEKQEQPDDTSTMGGFMSAVIKDADGIKQLNSFSYDRYGNVAVTTDGKGNEIQQRYNTIGKVETFIGRKPDANITEFHFDEDYNIISETKAFAHYIFDKNQKTPTLVSSKNLAIYSYNDLNNLTDRSFGDGDKMVTEKYVLDANENLVQFIQPMGKVTEYKYDERNLLLEKILGPDGKQPSSYRYSYTKSGQLRRQTDPGSNYTAFNYDGYQRAIGFSNPTGASVIKTLDDNGNTEKIQTWGYADDSAITSNPILLEERIFKIDEWNRVYKISEKCFEVKTGEALGKSDWDDDEGIVSSLVEYGDNNLPVNTWKENNNIISVVYDGLGRKTNVIDATGAEVRFEYDANDNITRQIKWGNEGENAITINNQYDGADRLISRKKDNENAKSLTYNAVNDVIKTVEKSGIEIFYLHDSLGRANGKLYNSGSGNADAQLIVRTQEYNDNFQLTAFTNANGLQTTYQYDNIGRMISKTNENGNTYHYIYDERSSIKIVTTPGDRKITHSFDTLGRLEKRQFEGNDKKEETFKYDSKNRLIAAASDKAKMIWEYDSLSRILKQTQNEKCVGFTHDNAGNLTGISYPGGKVLHYSYDASGRVTAIADNQQRNIAIYQYTALGQFNSIIYYNESRADFTYDEQQLLESIVFTDTANQKLLDGCRYGYDDAGRVIFEVHLYQGKDKGDRYFYDDANRLIKAQYGVDNVSDINSSFEKETLFTYTLEGLWADKTTLDDKGNILKKERGVSNTLNNYASLGSIAYAYDKEGNCIMEAMCKEGIDLGNTNAWAEKDILDLVELLLYWTYEYDEHMRISKAVQHDGNGKVLLTIEYYYDTSSHLIERIETDANGVKIDYTFVYAGDMLIEEYIDGNLLKDNTLGPTLGIPLKTDFFDNGGWQESLNFFDGRQNVTSIIDGLTNAAKQRFGYDGFGAGHIFEFNGVPISPNDPLADLSNSMSSLLHGLGGGLSGQFGKAMFMFTDVKNGREMLNGNGHNARNGHTANHNSYMGGKNWGLISDGHSMSMVFNLPQPTRFSGSETIKPSNGVADLAKNAELRGGEANNGWKVVIVGLAINLASNIIQKGIDSMSNSNDKAKEKQGGGKDDVDAVIDSRLHEMVKELNDKNDSANSGKTDNKGSTTTTTTNNDGTTTTTTQGGTTTTTTQGGTTTTTTTTNKDKYSNPDDDSVNRRTDITLSEWQAVAAKFDYNKTPMNPALSSFTVTPEYFETPEEKHNLIARYGGGDDETGNGSGGGVELEATPPDPNTLDTNYDNGRLRTGPDFTNFPKPGGLNSWR